MQIPPKVVIKCLVYNHEPFLRDCLDGFVRQQTNFPFKAVVHDDCSTDGSAAIIQEYAEKYPDIIVPIYEKENQYSKRDGSLSRIMDAATQKYENSYFATCEGDDYWIDAQKLQNQVDYMDAHPECTMCCTNASVSIEEKQYSMQRISAAYPQKSGLLTPEDIITNDGNYITTCTILYRSELKADMPEEARKCWVGDYPLQIFAALKGKVYYDNTITAVYRYLSPGSWTSNMKKTTRCPLPMNLSIVRMLQALSEYSQGKHAKSFVKAQCRVTRCLLLAYPESQQEILSKLGWAILYQRVVPHVDIKTNFNFFIRKLLVWPYYPFEQAELATLPIRRYLRIFRKLIKYIQHKFSLSD